MENQKDINHRIYVSLDCLLDTRFGTLANLNSDLLQKQLQSGFVVREEENFEPLSKKTFLELYKTRDTEVLKSSPLTLCMDLVIELCRRAMVSSVNTPLPLSSKIIVNIFPFKLSDKEIKDLLISLVSTTKEIISIEIINENIEKLTPNACAQRFDCMIMYNYDEWLDIHTKNNNFRNIKSRKLLVFGPKIYFNRKPTIEERNHFKKEKIDPFKLIEELASSVIDLKLLDIGVFSVDLIKYKEQLTKT